MVLEKGKELIEKGILIADNVGNSFGISYDLE